MTLSRAEVVAEELLGTCKSLADFATDEEANDDKFLNALDDLVFECMVCGWWCEIGELAEGFDENTCNQCAEDL